MISLAWKIFYCLSVNHNPDFGCAICTSVTLFALVLHLSCTDLSQTEISFFFFMHGNYSEYDTYDNTCVPFDEDRSNNLTFVGEKTQINLYNNKINKPHHGKCPAGYLFAR